MGHTVGEKPLTSTDELSRQVGLAEGNETAWLGARAMDFFRNSRPTKIAAAFGATLAFAYGAWEGYQQSGKVLSVSATKQLPNGADNEFRFGSLNTEGITSIKTSEIGSFYRKNNLDALALQEVNVDDIPVLKDDLPYLNVKFVTADKKQHPLQGGFGVALLSANRLENVDTVNISGSGFLDSLQGVSYAAAKDVINTDVDLPTATSGWQETRSAISAKIQVPFADGTKHKFNIVTSHIGAGPNVPLHADQLNALADFVGDVKDQDPTVVCADFNYNYNFLLPRLAARGMLTAVNSPPHTSVTSGQDIDHCAISASADPVFGVGEVKVLKHPSTDHRAIIYSTRLEPRR